MCLPVGLQRYECVRLAERTYRRVPKLKAFSLLRPPPPPSSFSTSFSSASIALSLPPSLCVVLVSSCVGIACSVAARSLSSVLLVTLKQHFDSGGALAQSPLSPSDPCLCVLAFPAFFVARLASASLPPPACLPSFLPGLLDRPLSFPPNILPPPVRPSVRPSVLPSRAVADRRERSE